MANYCNKPTTQPRSTSADFYNQLLANSWRRAEFNRTFGNPEWALARWVDALQTNPARAQFYGSLSDYTDVNSQEHDQKAMFADAFKQAFVQELNSVWNKHFQDSVGGPLLSLNFVELGSKSGRLAAQTEVAQHGITAGCASAFQGAAQKAYDTAYAGNFTNGFNKKVAEYQQYPEIQAANFTVLTSGGAWVPGGGIWVQVTRIENGGEKPTTLSVSVNYDANFARGYTDAATGSVTAKALSNNETAQSTARLATVQPFAPNTTQTLTVNVGSFQQQFSVSIDPKNVLKALADATTSQDIATQKGYLLKYLGQEWKDHKGSTSWISGFTNLFRDNIYKDSEQSMLRDLVTKYKLLSPQEQAAIQQRLKADLVSLYVGGDKSTMASTKELISELQ